MGHKTSIFLSLSIQFLFLHLLLFLLPTSHAQLLSIIDGLKNGTEIYIIHVKRHERHELLNDEDLESWHTSFLPNSTLDSGAPRLIYSYRHVISGFAAHLTLDELETIKSKTGFLHARRDRVYHLTTTHTPRYLGLTASNGWGSTMMGEGIIIGVIDSGIIPDHPSFDDSAMPPPPPKSKWKGACIPRFKCNNKIIGAIGFKDGNLYSPMDKDGHGTHVASIVAGSFVKNANVLGMAKGTSSGMAPMAHLAIYKVCFRIYGCRGTDTFKAIDKAIKDGVDVISLSISGGQNDTFYEDNISAGTLAALQHGIVSVTAAGNDGAKPGTLSHSAPWVLVVGAVTTDRRIVSVVKLGNGMKFYGESAYQPKTWNSTALLPLEYPGENGDENFIFCMPSALANLNLRGKIVICKASEKVADVIKGEGAFKAGAEGMLLLNLPHQGYTTFSRPHVLPASNVNYTAGLEIIDYYFQNKPNAAASISFAGTEFAPTPSPGVVYLSSRGPSIMNGGIIKPDVVAPGVNILAAFHKDVGPNPNPLATHTFNFQSGTSMATPHVSGTAALIRTKHRGWTPSEIISAIITTANDSPGHAIIDDASNEVAGIYTAGAGQVDPIKAMDPGLVFGLTIDDYVGYLCGLGYSDSEVEMTLGAKKDCSTVKSLNAMELNYPSIAVNLTRTTTSQKVSRAAKNVGNAREEYAAKITEPAGVKISLSTYTLKFTRVDQVESYEISFAMSGSYPSQGSDMIRRGKIVWDSGVHVVTTPIAIRFV